MEAKKAESLKKKFKEAELHLQIASKAIIERTNADIVQIDIPRTIRGNSRKEWFRIWPGAEGNRIEVVNVDKRIKQLVLMVHEPRREFFVEQRDWRTRKTKKIKQTTTDQKRHFLCGVDERQLFIADLPRGCTTVADAHSSLKTATVTFAEGKAPGKTVRQGEWFFVHPTKEEKEAITAVTTKKRSAIMRKTAIGRGGNPHVAEELLRMPSDDVGLKLRHGYPAQSRDAIYVRGGIRHVDHKTVKFKTWRRVIRNNEPSGGSGMSGVNWID